MDQYLANFLLYFGICYFAVWNKKLRNIGTDSGGAIRGYKNPTD